jgi:opacity protein-like surface antigen
LTADYWSESSGSLAEQQVSVSDFAVGVNAKYRLDVQKYPKLTPYFGAGGAIHRFVVKFSEKTDDNVIDPYEDTYQDVEGELGADVMGGVVYAINDDIDLGGQVRYRNILDADVQLDQFVVDGSVQYKL